MRHINARGLALVKSFEGCHLTAYRCPANKLTIGFGSVGSHVKEGMTITQAEAEALLLKDLRRFEYGVEVLLGAAPTTGDQFSALVSFAFNLGLGNLQQSTLLKKHKRADFKGAAEQFLLWNKARLAGGLRVLPGLTRRRAAESRLYLGAA